MPTFVAPGAAATLTFSLVVRDPYGAVSAPDAGTITVVRANDAPRCDRAVASPGLLWPPNHKMVAVEIRGLTDPNNDKVTVTIDSVRQDEPVNGLGDGDTSPDAVIRGQGVLLRAERSGVGNGRVYHIAYSATDVWGASCTGVVRVGVPHSRNRGPIDGGPLYDSTQP
jgi:hypothetical protein